MNKYPPPPDAWIVVGNAYAPCRHHIEVRGIPVREVRAVWSSWHQDAKKHFNPYQSIVSALAKASSRTFDERIVKLLIDSGHITLPPGADISQAESDA